MPKSVSRAPARRSNAFLRLAYQVARFIFILALVVLPVPVAALLPKIPLPSRKNRPTELLKKE